MRLDKFTQKAREGILAAQQLAHQNGQQSVELEHLLVSLIGQEGGIIVPLLEAIGARPAELEQRLKARIDKLPRVSGGEPYLGGSLNTALQAAAKHAERLNDDYVSTEHLLLAAAESKSEAGKILKDGGVSVDSVLGA